LDQTLTPSFKTYSAALPVGVLHPADNAGLGLARAIAVAKVLKSVPALQRLPFCHVGAQLILPDDTLPNGTQAGDVKSRRRIEIPGQETQFAVDNGGRREDSVRQLEHGLDGFDDQRRRGATLQPVLRPPNKTIARPCST